MSKPGQHLRIDSIRLGQPTGRARKVTHLPWVDDDDGQIGRGQLGHDRTLVASGRFNDNQIDLLEQPHELGVSGGIVRERWRAAARFCFSHLGRMDVSGRECVPPYGPLIVVSNHLSFIDPPLIAASMNRSLYFFGKRGLFHDPFSSYVLRKFHVTPIDLSDAGTGALRTMLRMLGEDKAVVVFPEGHRSPDHTMKEGMLGVAYLALKSQAPILPVGLTGTEKLPGWRLPFPLRRLRVNIGQPFSLPVIEGRIEGDVAPAHGLAVRGGYHNRELDLPNHLIEQEIDVFVAGLGGHPADEVGIDIEEPPFARLEVLHQALAVP